MNLVSPIDIGYSFSANAVLNDGGIPINPPVSFLIPKSPERVAVSPPSLISSALVPSAALEIFVVVLPAMVVTPRVKVAPVGFLENQKDRTFVNSSLSAFDHKNNEDFMPKNYHAVTLKDNSDIVWFNVESRLNFNKKLFEEIGSAINNLEALCSTVVDNHLTYANNCGQNYLPVHTTTPGKYSSVF